MPVCTIHLLSLVAASPLPQFLVTLRTRTSLRPLTVARVVRWVILPTSISTSELLAQNIRWDVLLILPSADSLPLVLQSSVAHSFTLQAGVPSRLLQDFAVKNERLLHPRSGDTPPLTGSLSKPLISNSAQDLTLSSSLQSWIRSPSAPVGAVSMLNLLAFVPGKKSEYLRYGAEFAKSIGSRRGGNAKIVGNIIGEGKEWDEMALAHYPTLEHFADMLASEDYQEVNQRYRVPSLRDTLILCTSEVDGVGVGNGGLWEKGSKL